MFFSFYIVENNKQRRRIIMIREMEDALSLFFLFRSLYLE